MYRIEHSVLEVTFMTVEVTKYAIIAHHLCHRTNYKTNFCMNRLYCMSTCVRLNKSR